MKEEFLHYLWKYSLYDQENLLDNEGNKITVISPGIYNRDSGPDFFNARILIAGTEWAGNVEIHTKASYFDIHGHQKDPAYNNVILHVVSKNDSRVFNAKGEELLTVEIVPEPALYEKYLSLVNNPNVIACEDEINGLDNIFIRLWLNALVIERLKDKSELIEKILTDTDDDWEETFYRLLSRYFGFRVNTDPFEMLASSLPFKIIRKHCDNRFQIEALLFGTAGMLEEGIFKESVDDGYYSDLIREYRILRAMYNLKPIDGWVWKFSRLRPANFPTIRISQLAAMLSVTGGLFSKVLESTDIRQLIDIFEVTASDYWNDHFVFGKKSISSQKKTGSQATEIFLINAVIPVIFVYGKKRDRNYICERALNFLDSLRSEDNVITGEWKAAGIESESAYYSQALIQLKNEYCIKRRCLNCRIGDKIISNGKFLKDQNDLILEPGGELF